MIVLPHPDVADVFVAASVARAPDGWVSGTGLGRDPVTAELRSRAEIAERLALAGRSAGGDRAPLGLKAAAAGPTRAFAEDRALLELVERHAARLWWSGGTAPLAPDPRARARFERCRRRHGRRDGRRARLIAIADRPAPVLVAWSCARDGRALAFGLACRPDPAEAAEAALMELWQMEFGLGLARRRAARGLALPPGEARMLARAAALDRLRLRSLLVPRRPSRPRPRPLTARPTPAGLARYGLRIRLRPVSGPDGTGFAISEAVLVGGPRAGPGRAATGRWPLY